MAIKMSGATEQEVRDYAKAHPKRDVVETLAYFVKVAIGRLSATEKYASENAPAKNTAKKTAKKAAPKLAA
jgi:hypothetical protein